jgi:hypothetical protein
MPILQLAHLACGVVLTALLYRTALGQEMTLFGGGTRQSGAGDRSYGWALDYRHGLGRNAALTFSWLNEGHFEGHHRDGQAAQLWWRSTFLDERLALAAGAGPYRYYDTRETVPGTPTTNQHGWAGDIRPSQPTYMSTAPSTACIIVAREQPLRDHAAEKWPFLLCRRHHRAEPEMIRGCAHFTGFEREPAATASKRA